MLDAPVEDYAKAGRVPRLESGPEFKDSAGLNVPDPESANAIVDVFHHVKDAGLAVLEVLEIQETPVLHGGAGMPVRRVGPRRMAPQT